jgi:hypothetical protein
MEIYMQVIKEQTHEIFYVGYSSLLQLKPEDFIVSEDAGIGPWTVATLALTARRSNHSATSHARDFYVSFFMSLTPVTNTMSPQSSKLATRRQKRSY